MDAVNSLSTSLGGLSGTNISFNNANQTVNESSGTLQTSNNVSYRVFNVTSYSENNSDTVTIVGDGSGDPVVFNFAYNSNTNLGGQVALSGTGLTDDRVMWNFTSSGKHINLNNNGGTYIGVILAPDDQTPSDQYQSGSSNLYGRIYGGAGGNMQIVSRGQRIRPPHDGNTEQHGHGQRHWRVGSNGHGHGPDHRQPSTYDHVEHTWGHYLRHGPECDAIECYGVGVRHVHLQRRGR